MDSVNRVVNKASGTKEFAASLGTDAEDIFAFYCCAAGIVSDGMVDTSRQRTFAQSGYETEFTWFDLSC
jgi:hypothetical protein